LVLGAVELLLALVERLRPLLQLRRDLGAVALEVLELAELCLRLLLALRRERLLRSGLRLELGDPAVLFLDRPALLQDALLARLELGLELGQLSLPVVEGARAPAGIL